MDNKTRKRDFNLTTNENILAFAPLFILNENNLLNAEQILQSDFTSHQHKKGDHTVQQAIESFFTEHDLDSDTLLSNDELSWTNELFDSIDTDEDGYISQTELQNTLRSLLDELHTAQIDSTEFNEVIDSIRISLNDFEALDISSTQKGFEATIEGDYEDSNPLYITLDDTSANDDSITVNFIQEDGVDQLINELIIEGIEDITFDINTDTLNTSDDLVSVSKLVLNDAEILDIISEESISLEHIYSNSLKTIDLSEAVAGFDLKDVDSTSGITYILDTIGDGTGILNFDSDNDGTLDSSVSSIGLSKNVQDIIEFSSQSLESSLIINGVEVGVDDTDDIFDFSNFEIGSMDNLVFTDYEQSTDTYCHPHNSVQITSEYFDGTLILNGVLSTDIDSDNFIF